MIPTDFLTPKEAAEYLRVSISTLAKFRVYGNGPTFCRFGSKAVRYQQSDLDEYMLARRASSTSARPSTAARELLLSIKRGRNK